MKLTRLIAVITLAWAGFMVVSIVMSQQEMGLWEGLRRILETRWGVTTMVDLYAGLTFAAVWIGLCERSWTKGIVWGIALAMTGNLATLVYVSWRAWRAESVREIFMPAFPSAGVKQSRPTGA